MRIALDDFGTGYSSLACLRSLPVDILKVAKPFVDGAGRTPHDHALLAMIIELGSLFGVERGRPRGSSARTSWTRLRT